MKKKEKEVNQRGREGVRERQRMRKNEREGIRETEEGVRERETKG